MSFEPHGLLPSQRRAIYHAIEREGLQPRQFDWTTGFSEELTTYDVTLTHQPSGYHMRLVHCTPLKVAPHWVLTFSPGEDILTERLEPKEWFDVINIVEHWLELVRREVSESDPWVAFEDEMIIAAAAAQEDPNRPFSEEERHGVTELVDTLRGYLTEHHELTEEQTARVESQLAYLRDASFRMGRKDWLMMVIGTLLSVATGAGLSSTAARAFASFAKHGLAVVFPDIAALLP